MGRLLTAADDGLRTPGPEANWNESRYVDFYDPHARIGGWFRTGNRVNEGHAELSVCLYLPDGGVAVAFERPKISANGDTVDGLSWTVARPFEAAGLHFSGPLSLLADSLALENPRAAFAEAKQVSCDIRLDIAGDGLSSVLGSDQDHVGLVFLPGQAHGHYQHLVRVRGQATVGENSFAIAGVGGRDHSWGPRNWFAKTYFRWLIANTGDGFGFMAIRSAGQTLQRKSGFVWENGTFHLLDDVALESDYDARDYHQRCRVSLRANNRSWTAEGEALHRLPLRHRQTAPDGSHSLLRIVKGPMRWRISDGRIAWGSGEYHDQMVDGRPAGLGI